MVFYSWMTQIIEAVGPEKWNSTSSQWGLSAARKADDSDIFSSELTGDEGYMLISRYDQSGKRRKQ